MGKKKKKSNKKLLKKFMKNNRVILAALTGAATGITLAGILGTERAKEMVRTVEGSLQDFNKGKVSKNSYRDSDHEEPKTERVAKRNQPG